MEPIKREGLVMAHQVPPDSVVTRPPESMRGEFIFLVMPANARPYLVRLDGTTQDIELQVAP